MEICQKKILSTIKLEATKYPIITQSKITAQISSHEIFKEISKGRTLTAS